MVFLVSCVFHVIRPITAEHDSDAYSCREDQYTKQNTIHLRISNAQNLHKLIYHTQVLGRIALDPDSRVLDVFKNISSRRAKKYKNSSSEKNQKGNFMSH